MARSPITASRGRDSHRLHVVVSGEVLGKLDEAAARLATKLGVNFTRSDAVRRAIQEFIDRDDPINWER